jgi:hypothetical protein
MSNRAVFVTIVAVSIGVGAVLGVAVAAALPSTWHEPDQEEGIT